MADANEIIPPPDFRERVRATVRESRGIFSDPVRRLGRGALTAIGLGGFLPSPGRNRIQRENFRYVQYLRRENEDKIFRDGGITGIFDAAADLDARTKETLIIDTMNAYIEYLTFTQIRIKDGDRAANSIALSLINGPYEVRENVQPIPLAEYAPLYIKRGKFTIPTSLNSVDNPLFTMALLHVMNRVSINLNSMFPSPIRLSNDSWWLKSNVLFKNIKLSNLPLKNIISALYTASPMFERLNRFIEAGHDTSKQEELAFLERNAFRHERLPMKGINATGRITTRYIIDDLLDHGVEDSIRGVPFTNDDVGAAVIKIQEGTHVFYFHAIDILRHWYLQLTSGVMPRNPMTMQVITPDNTEIGILKARGAGATTAVNRRNNLASGAVASTRRYSPTARGAAVRPSHSSSPARGAAAATNARRTRRSRRR